MKKLAIIPLIVLFCLGLSGCNVLTDVSQYFAGLEDFVRGNPRSSVDIGEDGDGDGGDGNGNGSTDYGPHTLTVVCFKRPLLNVKVYGDETPEAGGRPVDHEWDTDIKSGIHFVEYGFIWDGDYTLEFETGQEAEEDLEIFSYEFQLRGADLTLMVMVNEKPAEEVRSVRVVELPGSGVATNEGPAGE